MSGEPDAGKPHVRFDKGVLETCDNVTRLHRTLPIGVKIRMTGVKIRIDQF